MQGLSPSMEDYIEAIYLAMREKGSVRPGDLSARLDVSASSVTEALRLLRAKGLVTYVRYGTVSLTGAGLLAAEDVYYRHRMMARFLVDVLGVEAATAEESACRLEHAVSPDILQRFVEYMHFLAEPHPGPGRQCRAATAFKEYYLRKKASGKGER